MGPPCCERKEHALALEEHFKYQSISTGDLLKKEYMKKSDLGKKISEEMKKGGLVEDDIVIELVMNQIKFLEEKGESWIINGFPRT